MAKKQNWLITFLPAFIFITNELIRTYIRPVYGQKKYGEISYILGWLPNYLAAFGIVATAVVVVPLVQELTKQPLSRSKKILILIGTSIFGLLGLIWHEVGQKGSGLFFDMDDIYATLAGTVTGDLFYYFLLIRTPESRAKD